MTWAFDHTDAARSPMMQPELTESEKIAAMLGTCEPPGRKFVRNQFGEVFIVWKHNAQ